VIAADTSALVAYFAGELSSTTQLVDDALQQGSLVLPPVVLVELLCAPNLAQDLRSLLLQVPRLSVLDGY
jgi:predicted nucleic acid-binding protein